MYSLSEIQKQIVITQQLLQKSLIDEGKKISGSYYTPDFIVEYIVKQAISQKVVDEINYFQKNKKIQNFEDLKNNKDPQIFEILYKQILPNIAICDITMGWGVFLLAAFDFLIFLYNLSSSIKMNDEEIDKNNFSDIINNRNQFIDIIISNNIFGTDLSPISVELAKLKLIEKALLYLKQEKALLPDFNLVVGNSLIGNNFNFEGKQFSFDDLLLHSIKNHFSVDEVDSVLKWLKKESLVHWNTSFSFVKKKGGFDIIVGNPPYINVKKINRIERKLYSKLFKTYNPNGDISNIFWERSIDLSNQGAIISLITPRYWLEGNDSNRLRKYLLQNAKFKEIIDFRSNRTLFLSTENKLGIDTAIVSIQKQKKPENKVKVLISLNNSIINSINENNFRQVVVNQNSLSEKKWIFERNPILSRLEDNAHYNLGDDKKHKEFLGICYIGKGCSTGNNRIFRLKQLSDNVFQGHNKIKVELEENEVNALRQLIKNSDISKYNWSPRNDYWIFLKGKNIDNYPNIRDYLSNFTTKLEKTQRNYGLKNYFDYAAYRSLNLIDSLPKIICPYQAKDNRFALLVKNNTLSTINETDVITLVIKENYVQKIDWKYLVSILNSELIQYYSMINNKKVYNLYDFRSNQLANFPVMKCKNQLGFNYLVSILIQILNGSQDINSNHINQITEYLFKMIDSLVYEAYFSDLLSTDFNEQINSYINFSSKNINQLKKNEIFSSIKEMYDNDLIKKNMEKINELPEIQTIRKYIKTH